MAKSSRANKAKDGMKTKERKSIFMNLPFQERTAISFVVRLYKNLRRPHSLKRTILPILSASVFFGVISWLTRGGAPLTIMFSTVFLLSVPFCEGAFLVLLLNAFFLKRMSKNAMNFILASSAWVLFVSLTFGQALSIVFSRIMPLHWWIFSISLTFGVIFATFYVSTKQEVMTSAVYSAAVTLPYFFAPLLFSNPLVTVPSIAYYTLRSALLACLLAFDFTFIIVLLNNIIASNLGVNGIRLVSAALAFSSGNKGELKDIISDIAYDIETYCGLIVIKRKGARDILMVSPSIHPGPFHGLGGADLQVQVDKAFSKKYDVIVFHGPATHDEDPASPDEISKLIDATKAELGNLKFGSNFGRLHKRDEGDMRVTGQFIGVPLVTACKITGLSDDISAALGAIVFENGAILVDCHNRTSVSHNVDFWKGTLTVRNHLMHGVLSYGEPACFDFIKVAHATTQASVRKKTHGKTLTGFGKVKLASPQLGIGVLGVRSMAVKTEMETTVYVVIDGNNLIDGLREKIEAEIKAKLGVDHVIVCTTDSHEVNKIEGDLNPVGQRLTFDTVADACVASARAALSNLKESMAGGSVFTVRDLKILGVGTTRDLVTTVRTLVSLSDAVIPAIAFTIFILSVMAVAAL